MIIKAIRKFLYFCALAGLVSCSNVQEKMTDPLSHARSLIEKGELDKGLGYLEEAMLKDPSRLALSNYYRFHASKNKQFERPIVFFKKAIEGKQGDYDEMYYNLGFAYIDKIPSVGPMGAGFLSKRAIKQFQLVLDRDPKDWIATYAIGMNYLHWPDYFKKNDQAMIYLEKATDLQDDNDIKPFYILTYIRLGDAYAKNGKFDKAYEMWKAGLKHYSEHQDLITRYNTPRSEIADAIRLLYNPNNSIGEINTDISVLWEAVVPASLVPLGKNSLQQAGVGGQLKGSKIQVGKGKIGLFSWFMRNLPFLSDKSRFQSVDMSALGIGGDAETQDLASIVAHGMIMGFLSQFEEESPQDARKRADKLSPFHRPFFHEGLGMGYAATASLDDISELKTLIKSLKEIDPNYTRLHLAGAGMWYGLESGNIEKVKDVFPRLGEFGQAYAYEGYGFSQTLFYFKNNPELLKNGEKLSDKAARNFYHGAGRALWILSGQDIKAFNKRVELVPQKYRPDAFSGYGMGVAFTKVESPSFIFSYLDNREGEIDLSQFLTGVSMGLTIRNMGDSEYVSKMAALASPENRCRLQRALTLGESTLESVSRQGGDLHDNWRAQIHSEIVDQGPISQWKVCL